MARNAQIEFTRSAGIRERSLLIAQNVIDVSGHQASVTGALGFNRLRTGHARFEEENEKGFRRCIDR